MFKQLLSFAMGCVLLASCNSLTTFTHKTPPYDGYRQSLLELSLDKTTMGQAWIQAGERALQDSIVIPLPFSESGYFNATQPGARSYRFNAREGQVLTVTGTIRPKKKTRAFFSRYLNGEIAAGHHSHRVIPHFHSHTNSQPTMFRVLCEFNLNC